MLEDQTTVLDKQRFHPDQPTGLRREIINSVTNGER